MAEAGILAPDARVELIDGEVIDTAPIGSQHAGLVDQLTELLRQAIQGDAWVRTQNPLHLDEASEPQPDIAVVKWRPDYYKSAHPTAEDVLLLIEVGGSSIDYDRRIKLPLYSRHKIPKVWLVDLNVKSIFEFREPGTTGYAESNSITGRGTVTTGVEIDLSNLFR